MPGRSDMKTWSIKAKTSAVACGIIAVAIVVLSFVFFGRFSGYYQAQADRNLDLGINGLNRILELKRETLRNHGVAVTSGPNLPVAILTENTHSLKAAVGEPTRDVSFAIVFSDEGKPLARNDGKDLGVQLDLSWIGSRDGTEGELCGVHVGEFGNYPFALVVACPIRASGVNAGFIVFGHDLTNHAVVDETKALFGLEATIFKGPVRMTTTVSDGGNRAVGTTMSGPVEAEVLGKEVPYKGEADVVGRAHITRYEPLRWNGQVIGSLFVGYDLSEITAFRRNLLFLLTGSSLVVLLFAFLLLYFFTRRNFAPFDRLQAISERVQGNDLMISDSDYGKVREDEAGRIAGAFRVLVEALQSTIRNIDTSAVSLTEDARSVSVVLDSSKQVAGTLDIQMGRLSDILQTNVASMEEADAGLQEIASAAQGAAQSAADGVRNSSDTVEVARKAEENMARVLVLMKNSDSLVEDSVSVIREMEDSVGSISSFVTVVSGIADQTNLLALNAAIEAARAGEAGRGFAVVAEEVRKLAEESGQAAKEVGHLVEVLKGSTDRSVSAMETIRNSISETVTETGKADEGIRLTMEAISKIDGELKEIARMAEGQSAASEEITGGISLVTQGIEEESTLASSLKEASERLAGETGLAQERMENLRRTAEELKAAVEKFRVDAN